MLVNSVKIIINTATIKIITKGEAPPNILATACPKTSEAPESFKIALRVYPPPNSIKTPHSVFFATSFQVQRPKTTTATAAPRAIKPSLKAMPVKCVKGLANIQQSAVVQKTIIVKILFVVQGISTLASTSIFLLKSGLNKK